MNISAMFPNSPTPDLPLDSWDFDPGYNLVLQGAYANYLFTELNIYLNSASIICGFLVIVIVLLLRSYDSSLVDRVSLRLTVVISAVDVVKAASFILFTFVATPGVWCAFTAWLILFLTNYYTFLSVAIAFNLQWVFLQKKPVYKWLEAVYFLGSLALALATSIPAWAKGRLGLDPNYGVCWFLSYSTKRTIFWEWLTFLSWNIIGTIYCFLVVVMVVVNLKLHSRKLEAFRPQASSRNTHASNRDRKAQNTVNKLVTRISLYALIPIVTQGGWYLNELFFQFGHYLNFGVDFWCIVGTDLPGVFNLIAFSMDPALANSLRFIKRDLLQRYGGGNAEKNPPTNSNQRFLCWFTRVFLGGKKIDSGYSVSTMQSSYGGVPTTISIPQGHTLADEPVTLTSNLEEKRLIDYGVEPVSKNRVTLAGVFEVEPTPEADASGKENAGMRRRKNGLSDDDMDRVLRGL